MAKFKIKNTNIMHNGDLKKIGDIIELTKDEADKLADVLIPIKETATKTEKPEKTETKTAKQKTQDEKTPETKNETKTETTNENGGDK